MENSLAFYQQCIKEVLSEYERLHTEWSKVELLFDDERGHYMVLRVGWFKQKRVHRCLIHIDISGDEEYVGNMQNLANVKIDAGGSVEVIAYGYGSGPPSIAEIEADAENGTTNTADIQIDAGCNVEVRAENEGKAKIEWLQKVIDCFCSRTSGFDKSRWAFDMIDKSTAFEFSR